MEEEAEIAPVSHRRQRLLVALLFLVALINYFDRQSLSVVAPRFQAELNMGDRAYGHIVSLFLFASAIAYALAGFISDTFGTRRSMALFVGWWSLAEASTAFATSTLQLGIARFCLGLGEPGLWVAAPKAVGECFERSRRGLAIGVYTMGATTGAVVALPAIAVITSHLPWRSIFLIDGGAGLLWVPVWLWCFRKDTSPRLGQKVHSADQNGIGLRPEGGLSAVLDRSSTWKLMVARGLTDPVWYFYLFWFPKYLFGQRGLSLAQVAHLGWAVYFAAGIGTLAGGLFSATLMRRGLRAGMAYRYTMFAAACLMPLSAVCAFAVSTYVILGIASIVAFAHMIWLVTLTATVVELYPPSLIGKAAGLIAAGSGLGGMVASEAIAWFVTHGGYRPVFLLMALPHPIAIALLWRSYTPRQVWAEFSTA